MSSNQEAGVSPICENDTQGDSEANSRKETIIKSGIKGLDLYSGFDEEAFCIKYVICSIGESYLVVMESNQYHPSRLIR